MIAGNFVVMGKNEATLHGVRLPFLIELARLSAKITVKISTKTEIQVSKENDYLVAKVFIGYCIVLPALPISIYM